MALFLSFVFSLAGGIGNLLGRLSNNGLVTDFINIGIGQLRTGVFNVADMAITFGAITAGYWSIRHYADEAH
jgi:signal peptidase II